MRTLLGIAIFIIALVNYDLATNFYAHIFSNPGIQDPPGLMAMLLGMTGLIPFFGIIPAALGAFPLCPFSAASGLIIAQVAILLFYKLVKARDNIGSKIFFEKDDCILDCALTDYMRNVFCGIALRRGRRSYIWANLILLLPIFVIFGVALLAHSTYAGDIDGNIINVLIVPTTLLYIIGNIVLAIQRVHDLGKSVWLLVLAWVTISCAHLVSPMFENIANVIIWGCLIFLPGRPEGLKYAPA